MKTKTGPTTGPWRYDDAWSLIKGGQDDVEIAAVHAAVKDGQRSNRALSDVARANAYLLAAAPALLEAAKYATCPKCAHNRCAGLRAAIAKAEEE